MENLTKDSPKTTLTSQSMSVADSYAQVRKDYKAKHGNEIASKDLVEGLRKRIKGDDSDPVFNFLSSKVAQQIFDEELEVKTEVSEKVKERKGLSAKNLEELDEEEKARHVKDHPVDKHGNPAGPKQSSSDDQRAVEKAGVDQLPPHDKNAPDARIPSTNPAVGGERYSKK